LISAAQRFASFFNYHGFQLIVQYQTIYYCFQTTHAQVIDYAEYLLYKNKQMAACFHTAICQMPPISLQQGILFFMFFNSIVRGGTKVSDRLKKHGVKSQYRPD